MRARDARAISFCGASMLALLVGSQVLIGNLLASLALTAAYGAFILTRPRMIRVWRRLRGEPDWSGYFDNDGARTNFNRAPGPAASPPGPAGRR
ncbi:MAG TPA: hypothetical protein VJS38_14325 [Phenylobacterium sp.]|uniref:hypothetical protein n=1 Tax=Phenylobacterium sp. TaxID=1871053 RepID=UPI002B45DDC2|nr:hypothetical protein [Phenylobacterium sp.]HKR89343.1 hypothetical protein [Phenylobacterium sp.]